MIANDHVINGRIERPEILFFEPNNNHEAQIPESSNYLKGEQLTRTYVLFISRLRIANKCYHWIARIFVGLNTTIKVNPYQTSSTAATVASIDDGHRLLMKLIKIILVARDKVY